MGLLFFRYKLRSIRHLSSQLVTESAYSLSW